MKAPAKKAIVIAIDGASMELVRNQIEWGNMPNVAALMKRGVWRAMLGVFPTLTPPGWTALYTGSWHPTHGVMDFNIRSLGKSLNETTWGINTALCKSEYLWNTAERAGKRPILVKVEMSWPPTVKRGIQIEGTGPGISNYHQISGYHLFVAGKWAPRPIGGSMDPVEVDPSALHEGVPYDAVELQPADSAQWESLPGSGAACLEAALVLNPLSRGKSNMLRGRKGVPKTFFACVYAAGSSGYDRVRVCRSRNADDHIADVGVGEWSDFQEEEFEIDGSLVRGNVRMKLIGLTPNADAFEIFIPQIWPIEGFTYPEDLAGKLYEKTGPFLQNPARDALGQIDDDTYFEALEYHHEQLAKAAEWLTTTGEWDILFTESHAPDYASHFFLGQADEISGADEQTIRRCRAGLSRTYASVDRWIGRLADLADEHTVIAIASDHGGTPSQHKPTDTNTVLEQAGLLVRDSDGEVDLSRTKAMHVGLVHVFINLKGREPGGIVQSEDYEDIQRQVIDALLDYRDPKSGQRPYALAVTRSDAETLNLWGELTGDVVFALRPAFDGAHGQHMPLGAFGIGGQHSTFVMAGAGVRRGAALERQVRVIDVAPTLCHLLGWPVPKNAEGGVIYEALEDPNWHLR